MTIILLLILLLIALGFLVQQWRYRRRIVRTSSRLIANLNYRLTIRADQCRELEKNYEALEEGQQEIIDNYENDLLEYKERMEAAQNSAKYDRERLEEIQKKLEQANFIIEKHSDKCDILVEDIADMLIAEVLPKENHMIQHNHASDERCDENGCTADRYADGEHVFTDKTVETTPADE